MLPAFNQRKPAAPRARLNQAFIAAVRASGCPVRQLAALGGFPNRSQFSTLLGEDSGAVAVTPLTLRRLRTVARLIGFDAQLFEREEQTA
jgi:hypothetical protein